MDQILRDLYRGNYAIFEKSFCRTPEHQQTLDAIHRIEEVFREELSPELFAHFKEYMEATELLSYLNDEDVFIEGFRLATQLMVAGLSTDVLSKLHQEKE